MEFIFVSFLAFSYDFTFFSLVLCLFLFSLPCVIPYVHPNPAIHRLATNVNEALFCTGVTTLLRDPWGGLSLVPLITSILCLFSVDNLIAEVRKTRETLYRHFYYQNQY